MLPEQGSNARRQQQQYLQRQIGINCNRHPGQDNGSDGKPPGGLIQIHLTLEKYEQCRKDQTVVAERIVCLGKSPREWRRNEEEKRRHYNEKGVGTQQKTK